MTIVQNQEVALASFKPGQLVKLHAERFQMYDLSVDQWFSFNSLDRHHTFNQFSCMVNVGFARNAGSGAYFEEEQYTKSSVIMMYLGSMLGVREAVNTFSMLIVANRFLVDGKAYIWEASRTYEPINEFSDNKWKRLLIDANTNTKLFFSPI